MFERQIIIYEGQFSSQLIRLQRGLANKDVVAARNVLNLFDAWGFLSRARLESCYVQDLGTDPDVPGYRIYRLIYETVVLTYAASTSTVIILDGTFIC